MPTTTSGAAIKPHPGDAQGVPGVVYVLHLEPPYRHAAHYVGWTAAGRRRAASRRTSAAAGHR